MATATQPVMQPGPSPEEMKAAQEQVFQDTMELAKEVLSSVSREERIAIAAQVAAIKIR